MAKQSPPIPVMCGSTTHSTASAVTAASAALPPARSVSIAASDANGCEVAAMPSPAMTGEREQQIAGRDRQAATLDERNAEQHVGERHVQQKRNHVVEGKGDQQQRKCDQVHAIKYVMGELTRGRGASAPSPSLQSRSSLK